MTPHLSHADVAVRLLIAAALTGAVGLERELRERAAGLRTHMLVGVGAALFTIVSAYAWTDFIQAGGNVVRLDPTRVAAQIVTGIGFLGAGAIIRQGLSVRGLTTAAGLWVVAAIGTAIGAGFYSAGLITTGIVLVGLGPFRWLEGGVLRSWRRQGRVVEVDIRPQQPVAPVLSALEGRRVRITQVELEDEEDRRQLRVELDVPFGSDQEVVEQLSRLDEVIGVRWSG
ncbi:MAG: MgtC/SapB family protein [Actinobacteria bacterium]|nr:MAG: MgtC/SapB family protein [Actinomycetota bacterium]